MKSIYIRPKKRLFYYYIVLFFIATPAYFAKFQGIINYLFIAGELLTYIYITFKWINRHKRSASLLWVLTILLYGYIILLNFIRDGDLFQALRHDLRYIFVVMLIESEEDHILELWRACIIYFTIVVLINFITILLYPRGMNYIYYQRYSGQREWFFANKNGLGKFLLCLLYFKASYDFKVFNRLTIWFYIIAALCLISEITIWSATSVVCVAIMIVMLLLTKFIKTSKFKGFNIYIFMGIILALMTLFVYFNNVLFFNNLLTVFLRKNETFNDRTYIWAASFERIRENPIFGYGYLNQSQYVDLIGIRAASDSHNLILTFAINGGLIAVVLFLCIIFIIMKNIHKNQYNYENIILTSFMFCFFLMMIFEGTSTTIYWMIFAFAARVDKLEQRNAKE